MALAWFAQPATSQQWRLCGQTEFLILCPTGLKNLEPASSLEEA